MQIITSELRQALQRKFLLLLLRFIYSKGRVAEREIERETFHLLICSPNGLPRRPGLGCSLESGRPCRSPSQLAESKHLAHDPLPPHVGKQGAGLESETSPQILDAL